MLRDHPRRRVEPFISLQRVDFDVVAQRKPRWEGVAELDDAEGGDDGDETEEIGDGGGDYEGDGPIDGDDDCPEDFAGFGG